MPPRLRARATRTAVPRPPGVLPPAALGPVGLAGWCGTFAKVAYQDRLRVVLRHTGMADDAAVQVTYWFDTVPRDRGPEFRLRIAANAGLGQLERVDSWAGAGRERPCRRLTARADVFSDDPVVVRMPGACLGHPKKVRVAVKVREVQQGQPAQVDWVPGKRTFTAWVRRH